MAGLVPLPASLADSSPVDGPAWADDVDGAMRGQLRRALIGVGVLVLGLVLPAALVPIGGAVVAAGQVGVESRVKRIAHPLGGIVAEMPVRNGDHVAKGDLLMRLDTTVSGADAQLSALSVDQLLAQRARLEAERLGNATLVFPAELAGRGDSGARKAMADERKLFAIRREEGAGLRAQLSARVAQYRQQIAGFDAQIQALQQQAALIEPERAGVKELWEKNLVTINRLNQLERTRVDLTGQVASLRTQIAQANARITEAREQMIQMEETRRSDAGTQLAALNATLNQQQVRSVSAGDAHGRALIRAPYSGTVDKLAFATLGDVVKPAETIMEVVPDSDRLVVEASVNPADIDQVRAGQKARIRFTAFSNTATPEIAGEVMTVAPERTTDPQTRASFYAVRIAVDERALAREPSMRLVPGMPTEVYIRTGSRTMLSYLTKPLRDQFARSFNDN